jgi:hypothetical protein
MSPLARTRAFSDAIIRRRLWVVLCLYETLVIAIVAGAGLNIALMGGGSLVMAAPLLLIACAEALRIPLSGWSTRLGFAGRMLAGVALIAIAIGSFEGLTVAFEAFLQNRVVEIMRAAHDVEKAQRAVDLIASVKASQDADVAGLTAQVKELDDQVSALAKSLPTPPVGSNKTCTWKGQRVACSSDSVSAQAYSAAMKAYDICPAGLTSQRSALQAKVDDARAAEASTVSPRASQALADAKQAFAEKAEQSPVFRITAAVFNEDVGAVTPAQFSVVKKWATVGLGSAFALLSIAVSVVVHLQPKSERRPSKLARAIRAMVAARRKTIRRLRETVRVETRERVKFIHIPVDVATGRVIDPDGKLGETVNRDQP